MDTALLHTALYRTDVKQNMFRFYTVDVQANLFGGHSVVRNWGRIGTFGRLEVETYLNPNDAELAYHAAIKQKRRRGYTTLR